MLLSSMPAWQLVDPIPILARLRTDDEEDWEDAESLNSMVRTESDDSGSEPEAGVEVASGPASPGGAGSADGTTEQGTSASREGAEGAR